MNELILDFGIVGAMILTGVGLAFNNIPLAIFCGGVALIGGIVSMIIGG